VSEEFGRQNLTQKTGKNTGEKAKLWNWTNCNHDQLINASHTNMINVFYHSNQRVWSTDSAPPDRSWISYSD